MFSLLLPPCICHIGEITISLLWKTLIIVVIVVVVAISLVVVLIISLICYQNYFQVLSSRKVKSVQLTASSGSLPPCICHLGEITQFDKKTLNIDIIAVVLTIVQDLI